jgi:protein-disulfide isomerase
MENLNTKTIALSIGGVLATILLLFGAWKLSSKPPVQEKVDITVEANDHIQGNKNSKVVLVEYSDFQCPACKAYHPVVKTLMKKYKDQILFVYRHYPLASHKNGPRAAQAAEAASRQGKFWEMHDLLFKNQDAWATEKDPTEMFVEFAKELKIDTNKFKKDIDLDELKNRINSNHDSGNLYRIASTPTFFLNGVKLDPPQSLDEFDGLINKQIEASK